MQAQRSSLLSKIGYLPAASRTAVGRAFDRAVEWHEGQTRESKEPYVLHPIAVAGFLAGLEADEETIVAALLHDVVEDERTSEEDVLREFGSHVAKLVDGVTKLSKMQYEGDRTARQIASLRKMLLVASDDLRVILIKLADRWHNIETIRSLRPEKQQRIAHETLDIYVPFARLMGLWELKRQFEEACFPLAFPEESAVWHEKIKSARQVLREEREQFVKRINSETAKEVTARMTLMTDYELFQKLYNDPQRLNESEHIDSVLIVISDSSSEIDCYKVMGQIHARYPVQTLSFRDNINAPLPNGYRGLHTTIFLGRNHELRLRIQTEQMYEYVTERKISSWITRKDNDIYAALASLRHSSFDKEQYLQDVKQSVLDRMNVFTTAGEIIHLPRGATGIDFAFNLNPASIASLAGIRVNGEPREATYELQDGDTVELVLLEKSERERNWLRGLEKIKSADVRESVKEGLRRRPQEQQWEEGKNLLQTEAQKLRLPLWSLFRWPRMQQQMATTLGEQSFSALLEKLGRGELSVKKTIDAYKLLLTESPSLFISILTFLHLLPRSRVLNKEATIIGMDIYAEDRQGLIYDITRCIAERKINIAKFAVFAVPPSGALYQIRVEVENFEEFSRLYDSLLQVPSVKNIVRKS